MGYFSEADELFYGGAAGGGKTDLLLGLATTAHLKSIIFRREYPQLSEILLRSHEILDGTDARFNGQDNVWRNIPGKRRLEFGAVQYEDDVNKYKGRSHDLKGFDELTDFTESQYRFLTAWSRTSVLGQRVRVIGASNPPMSGVGEWVINYWAPWLDNQHPHPGKPGELRWFAQLDGKDHEVESSKVIHNKGEEIHPKSRSFIPAKWTDNPYMVATGYGRVLENLPEPLRSILKNGDFFTLRQDDPWQVIPSAWVDLAMNREGERPPRLTQIGGDPSRGGEDEFVVAKKYGTNWIDPLIEVPGSQVPDGPAGAALVTGAIDNLDDCPNVVVDLIGWGSSVYDHLADKLPFVYGFNGAEASTELDKTELLKFANRRAEALWRVREALDPDSGRNIKLPKNTKLKQDLITPRWKLTTRGILVSSKEEIWKVLKRSTNQGDAVVLALLEVELEEVTIYQGMI